MNPEGLEMLSHNKLSASDHSEKHPVKVYVTFKYDLGGRVTDADGLRAALRDLCGTIEMDEASARSWNLSYLSRHSPVLKSPLAGGTASLAGANWHYERTLRIFPWLGVMSLDYEFNAAEGCVDLAAFYDALVEWKNSDYLPYLKKSGAMTGELASHTASAASQTTARDLHSDLVLELRVRLLPYIHPRPAMYAFHDFRVCFIGKPDSFNVNVVESLLWLTHPNAVSDIEKPISYVSFGKIKLTSTGWSTVCLTGPGADESDLLKILSLMSLIHAQWFVCQLWINVYDLDVIGGESEQQLVNIEELSACQLSLAHDLTEVGNLNIMLKDPSLLRVARSLEISFEVLEHRKAAEQRLRLLESYSRDIAEIARERSFTRLQILFSLSAAGTIAALIPALAQIKFAIWFTVATLAMLVVLWLGFVVKHWSDSEVNRSTKQRSSRRWTLSKMFGRE